MISTNWGAATDAGLIRRDNEDALLAQMPVFLVADGMGGHAAGEVAAALAVGQFATLAAGESDLGVETVARSIDEANRLVYETAASRSELRGMGTTVVGLALVTDRDQEVWLVFNVGDSRLYRLHDGELSQVTTDHSEVQELMERGAISSDSMRHHPDRNVITRALGVATAVEPDFWLLPPVPGERFLLATDGLTGEIGDDDIRRTLSDEVEPAVAATRLVELALQAGGHDNVTVVVVDVVAATEGPEEDTARGLDVKAEHDDVGEGRIPGRVLIDAVPTRFDEEVVPTAGPED